LFSGIRFSSIYYKDNSKWYPEMQAILHTPQLYKEPSQPVYKRHTDIEWRTKKVMLIMSHHSHVIRTFIGVAKQLILTG